MNSPIALITPGLNACFRSTKDERLRDWQQLASSKEPYLVRKKLRLLADHQVNFRDETAQVTPRPSVVYSPRVDLPRVRYALHLIRRSHICTVAQ